MATGILRKLTRAGIVLAISVGVMPAGSAPAAEPALASPEALAISERFGISLRAGTEDDSLGSLLARAVVRNPEIRARAARHRAALAAVPQARSLPDPRLTYTEQLRSVETRVGPQSRSFSLSQSFPWFGTLGKAGEVQEGRAEAVRSEVSQAVLDVLLGVRRDYAQLAYLDRQLEISRRHAALLSRWEQAASAGYATGRVQYADLVKIQVEVGLVNDRLAGLRDRRRPLLAALNAWADDPSDRPVAAALDSVLPEVDLSLQAIGPLLRSGNPSLVRWDALAESHAAGERLARALGRPSMTLGLNYIQVDPSSMPDVQWSGRDAVSISLGMTLPIWRARYDAGVQAAAEERMAALSSRSQREAELVAQLDRAAFEAGDARRRYELHVGTLVPKARQAMTAARSAYEAGAAGLQEMIDSERVLLEFQLTGARALADFWIALATVEHLTAAPLPR